MKTIQRSLWATTLRISTKLLPGCNLYKRQQAYSQHSYSPYLHPSSPLYNLVRFFGKSLSHPWFRSFNDLPLEATSSSRAAAVQTAVKFLDEPKRILWLYIFWRYATSDSQQNIDIETASESGKCGRGHL